MPGIGIGRGLGMVGGHGGGGNPGDGMNALLRDLFTTAVDPLVNGATEPGAGSTAGKRVVTGTRWKIIDGALRGGTQISAPAWGSSKVVFTETDDTGIDRQNGRALAALVIPQDVDSDMGFGWATATSVTTPLTAGHHWLNNGPTMSVSQPGLQIPLHGTGATFKNHRPIQLLVIVVQRAQGAFYLVSAPYAITVLTNSNDYIGIPAYPSARVLWVDDTTTTTPLFPHIGALDEIDTINPYPNGHYFGDAAVVDVSSWATDAGLATFLDRFTRADSTTLLGGSWTAETGGGTWGISSNQAYIQAHGGGFNRAWAPSGLTGDGIWRARIKVPTTATDGFGMIIRRVDANNYVRVWNNGSTTTLTIQTWVAGGFGSTIVNVGGITHVAGQTHEWVIVTKGNRYQFFYDGVLKQDWIADGTSAHLTGSGIGMFASSVATGARWDDVMAIPSTVTLPAELQHTTLAPTVPTVGATLATDTFTAADATAISGRTTDTGGLTWAVAKIGAGTGTWNILTNRARNTDTNDETSPEEYFAFVDPATANVEVESIIRSVTVDDDMRHGHTLRYTDTSNYLYVRLFMDSGQSTDEIEIGEMIGGSGQVVKKINIGAYYAINTNYTLKSQIIGNILHVFLDGVLVLTYRCRLTTGTKHGMYHAANDDGSATDSITIKALT